MLGYAIFDGQNRYWSVYPQGWVSELSHGFWYMDKCRAVEDAARTGGMVVRLVESGKTVGMHPLF